ncbi:hypothetical protein SAMN05192574_105223 [Mucilaginibacter gossypiicola]|uniref:Uncharacterized protein n=1 Tax=Mucilaginibacter gossypiicola TaxID=551995 RepID=A0A1H8LS05_9SPHI|nr:hypothetical protein [Mucilaginibacter gossypiicola]SEO07880.1 hypothetical protein SAMN05192574_105223 [Mucilaginibacter gossypiicola]
MRTIIIHIYPLQELGEAAKSEAINHFRDINVHFDWYEPIYLDFIAICETIGLTVKSGDIGFSGFYTQGSGSAFSAEADLPGLIDGIRAEAWKSYAPKLELAFAPLRIDRRVMALIRRGQLQPEASVLQPRRGLSARAYLDYGLPNHKAYERIAGELRRLEDWLKSVADCINQFLYRSLEREFEYQTTDEAIAESITANSYHFTIDGIFAGNIKALTAQNEEQP